MIFDKENYDMIKGEIYKITNVVTGKIYIGQTRSHRLNHGKYRPFGYLGRFNDHISEANSNKKNQSWYLNSSILKYGVENFICEKLLECNLQELNENEIKFISLFNTKYPNGYNLTDGGQNGANLKCEKIILSELRPVIPVIKVKDTSRSKKTKMLISANLKKALQNPNHRNKMMSLTQNQHLKKKFDRYKNVTIDESNIDQYVHIIQNNVLKYEYVRIVINKIKSNFIGKTENIEETIKRAKIFITELLDWQHNQIAGTSLEISSTTPLLETTDGGTRVMTDTNGKNDEILDNPQPSP